MPSDESASRALAEAQETFQDHPEPVNFLVVCFEDPRIAL